MRYKRALIQCCRCGKWSGWISRTKGGVKAIDTRCSPCGARLRHTERPDEGRQFNNCYRPGRGAHNRTTSVARFIPCTSDVDVKREAASRNTNVLWRTKAFDDKRGFVKAKDYDDVRRR